MTPIQPFDPVAAGYSGVTDQQDLIGKQELYPAGRFAIIQIPLVYTLKLLPLCMLDAQAAARACFAPSTRRCLDEPAPHRDSLPERPRGPCVRCAVQFDRHILSDLRQSERAPSSLLLDHCSRDLSCMLLFAKLSSSTAKRAVSPAGPHCQAMESSERHPDQDLHW